MFDYDYSRDIDQLIELEPQIKFEHFSVPESWWLTKHPDNKKYHSLVITLPNHQLSDHWFTRTVDIKLVLNPRFYVNLDYNFRFWVTSVPQIKKYSIDYKHAVITRENAPQDPPYHFRQDTIEGYDFKHKLYLSSVLPRATYSKYQTSLLLYYDSVKQYFEHVGSDSQLLEMSFPDMNPFI